ncbi:NIPSNAP family protein [Actinomadura roseirufa]|uniref:NIPSNAP family protein n=1 Tax=Actinomadura roseirufa TaxID=2094049 RepID=UPI001041A896|nr:NIPSNAP family protein [Actinomadura roseirufa]
MSTVLELRVYAIHPGQRDRFHTLMAEGVVPMLGRHGVDVVGHGPSRHDADHYYLLRAFPSVEAREKALTAFYGSREWNDDHDGPVMALIASYNTAVLPASAETARSLAADLA